MAGACGKLGIRTAARRAPEEIRRRSPTGVHQLRQHGIYRDAVAQFQEGLVAVPDITHHPWHITLKYGFGANLEQNLTPDLIAFTRGRTSWNRITRHMFGGASMWLPACSTSSTLATTAIAAPWSCLPSASIW